MSVRWTPPKQARPLDLEAREAAKSMAEQERVSRMSPADWAQGESQARFVHQMAKVYGDAAQATSKQD
jgi:hypothetical protein